MLNKLKSFSDERGYIMIDQWGPSDVREFRSSWNVSARTSATASCPKYGTDYHYKWIGRWRYSMRVLENVSGLRPSVPGEDYIFLKGYVSS